MAEENENSRHYNSVSKSILKKLKDHELRCQVKIL